MLENGFDQGGVIRARAGHGRSGQGPVALSRRSHCLGAALAGWTDTILRLYCLPIRHIRTDRQVLGPQPPSAGEDHIKEARRIRFFPADDILRRDYREEIHFFAGESAADAQRYDGRIIQS